MTKILIPTQVKDLHAVAVATVLRQLGGEPVLFHASDFPSKQYNSVTISNASSLRWSATNGVAQIVDEDFDVVWNRRLHRPRSLEGALHQEDQEFASVELDAYYRGVWLAIAQDAIWVNSRDSQLRAASKILQLRTARELGFSIPDTLISNDRRELIRFIESRDDDVIYKPFYSLGQPVEDGIRVFETTQITADNIPSDDVHRHTIGIFQRRVPKAYEVRATIFGQAAYAVRIDSQVSIESSVDWRNVPLEQVPMYSTELPPNVYEFCLGMLEKLDLRFGAFDFIVDPDDRWHFLEVNQAGQFLFLEQADPSVSVLSGFCHFLMSPTRDFRAPPAATNHALSAVLNSPAYQEAFNIELEHVPPAPMVPIR